MKQQNTFFLFALLSALFGGMLISTPLTAQIVVMKNRGLEMALKNGQIIEKHLYTVEDGLAANDPFCSVKDSDGFIWIATRNGLNRFDGKNFQLFNTQQGGLAYNRVVWVYKDENKHLFLQYDTKKTTYNFCELFDLTTHKIIPIKTAYPHLPFSPDSIRNIEDEANKLYFHVAPAQIWELNGNTFTLKVDVAQHTKYIPQKHISSDYLLTKGDNLLINYFDAKMPLIFVTGDKVHLIPKKYVSPNMSEFEYFMDANKNPIVNTVRKNGKAITLRLNFQGDTLPAAAYPFVLPKENYTYFRDNLAFLEDPNFIMEETRGIKRYVCQHGGNRFSYIENGTIPASFPPRIPLYQLFYYCFQDNLNNLWLSASYGFIKISTHKSKFEHYFTNPVGDTKIESQARNIYADLKGNVYANIWENVSKADSHKQIKSKDLGSILYALVARGDSLYATVEDSLYVMNKTLNKPPRRSWLGMGYVWAIHFVSEEEIIMGTDLIQLYNLKTKEKRTVSNPNFPKTRDIYRFFKDKENALWAVSQNGLYLIKNEKVIDYYGFSAKDTTHKLPCREILDAYLDDKGIFWIATHSEGLYRWDKQKHSFQQFTTANGFPSNILVRIERDDYGFLWISTENGLCRFNRETFFINTYTTNDGLSHNEFNRISSFRAEDGKLYFGGLNGVNGLNPKDFLAENVHFNVPLQVTNFAQFEGESGKIIDKTFAFLQQKSITLYPNDRFCELTVQLLNYEEGENHYAYKVEGVDKDWNYIRGNTLRLSGLPYGKFQLRVKAQNHWGVWNEKVLIFPLEVIAPFYLRTWFLILSFLLLISGIFTLIRWRTYNLKQEKRALEEAVVQRTEELQSTIEERDLLLKELHHRIKNNFSLILSLIYYQSAISDETQTTDNLNALHQRITSISTAHDLILNTYDSEFSEDSLYIDDYFYNLAQAILGLDKREVQLVFEVQKCMLNTDTSVPLGILLNELLSNSLKYAKPEGEVLMITIKLSVKEDMIDFQFSDNGTFFSEEKRSNSFGTTIIKSMARQLKGKMQRDGANYQFHLRIKNQKS
ncbi:MAG: histidine kinase dimerization/phosphoacceptor domain -containing protein [Bacteroidia bacterium]